MPTCWTNLFQDLPLNGILWKLKIFWLQLLAAGIAEDHAQSMSSFCFWLLLSQNTPTVEKKIAPTILNYIFVCNKTKHNKKIWGAGRERYWKQNYFLGLGMSPWNSNKLKWTLLKMVNGLSPNVENCRPEVIGLEKDTWAAERRLEHSLERAVLFLTSKSLMLSTVSETLRVLPGKP